MAEKLTLLARFSRRRVEENIIPEIEMSCSKYEVSQNAYLAFHKSRFTENVIYLYHGLGHEKDIPMDQEYQNIAILDEKGKIKYHSIQKCRSRVLCHVDKYRMLPWDNVWAGHTGLVLMQFVDGIPEMIEELYEIDKEKYIEYKTILCLFGDGD